MGEARLRDVARYVKCESSGVSAGRRGSLAGGLNGMVSGLSTLVLIHGRILHYALVPELGTRPNQPRQEIDIATLAGWAARTAQVDRPTVNSAQVAVADP
jgi:hypothetical protein